MIFKMKLLLCFAIFIVTLKGAQMNVTKLKYLPLISVKKLPTDGFADDSIFSVQIRETTSTTEAAPSTGSNLNLVEIVPPQHDEEHLETFLLETSTNQSFENENKKHETLQEVTIKSLSSFYLKDTRKDVHNEKNNERKKNFALLNNCLESLQLFGKLKNNNEKDEFRTLVDDNKDIEQVMNTNKKRDTDENDSLLLNKEFDEQIKREEIRQHQTTPTTEVTTEQKTSEDFNNPTEGSDVTLYFTETENARKATYTEEAWFETKDKTKIRFSKLPQRESYMIPTLKLEQGFYPFTFMSEFFTLIYPFDLSVGLIKDIVWGQISFPYSFLKSVKVESTFLIFIIIFSCIALIIPAYLICLGCMSVLSSRDEDDTESGALFPDEEDCNEKLQVTTMLFILLICVVCISGMTISSEEAANAVNTSHEAVRAAFSDIAKWLSSASRELYYSIVPPIDSVVHTFREDLRHVDSLLGQPIQKAISSESGINFVLESLNDITEESEDLANKISSLRDVTVRAGSLASLTSDRLKDLSRQLDNVKKHCTGEEIPLCDTINTNSMELRIKFNLILHEQQLLELRRLGVQNLTRAVVAARKELDTLPSAITLQTYKAREDILRQLDLKRESIAHSSRTFKDIERHLALSLRNAGRRIESMLDRFQNYDFWRRVSMTCCIVTSGVAVILIILAIIIGFGSAEKCGKLLLQISTLWICITSLVLWALLSTTFLIAGHAEIYVCRPLWDKPQYRMLTSLLDRPSPFTANKEGLIDVLFRDMNNITMDISVRDILRECEQDRPAYNVFKLDTIFDINKASSYDDWEEFHKGFSTLNSVIDVTKLKTVSRELNEILNQMLGVSNLSIAQYRIEYNGALVGKDLPALVDQLENIAAQITDMTTSSRLETLASRTQRLQLTNIKPLEQLRSEIVYKLTELELKLLPFRKKLNISLSHIHTAQYYIDNQGDVIAQKKLSQYSHRLIKHVASWRTHVLNTTSSHAAKCRPLFNVFQAIRTLLCSHYISFLHCWWVCALLLGALWCFTVPLCVNLWQRYGIKLREDDVTLANINNGGLDSTPTTICDTSNWNTPRPPPPQPNNDNW